MIVLVSRNSGIYVNMRSNKCCCLALITVLKLSCQFLILDESSYPLRRLAVGVTYLLYEKSSWEKSYFDQIEAPRASIFVLSCFFTTKVIDAG